MILFVIYAPLGTCKAIDDEEEEEDHDKYIKSLRTDNLGLAPLKSGATLVTTPHGKAELLLNEFSSVFTKEEVTSIPWLGPARAKIPALTINSEGVPKLLTTLKPHKAAGPDRLPNIVLKELADVLAPPLTALFNQTLENGTIPADWSQAIVTPVYKVMCTAQATIDRSPSPV